MKNLMKWNIIKQMEGGGVVMERFLFKGRDINYNNVIVENGIIEDDNGRMSIHTTVGWVEVLPGTVGVATGRFYDNGLPVFSGDIVNIEGFNGDYIMSYDKRDQAFKLRAIGKDETYYMGDFPDTAITKKNILMMIIHPILNMSGI